MSWVLFLRGLSGLLSEGVPIRLALQQMKTQLHGTSSRVDVDVLIEQVSSGVPFLDAWLSIVNLPMFKNFGRLGWTPNLIPVLDSIATHLEQVQLEKQSIFRQSRYPMVLFLCVLSCFALVFGWILPGYLPLLESISEYLPASVQWIVVNRVQFLGVVCLLFISILLVLFIYFFFLFRRFYVSYAMGQFCFLLGLLLWGGVSLRDALHHLSHVNSRYMFSTSLRSSFLETGDLLEAFQRVFCLNDVSFSLLKYYYLQQKLPTFLDYQSLVYYQSVFSSLRSFFYWFQPILYVVLVLFVVFSVFIVFLPMLYSSHLIG